MVNPTRVRRQQERYDEWLTDTRRGVVAAICELSLTTQPVTMEVTARSLTSAVSSHNLGTATVEERFAWEDQIGAEGMWWLRELAGSIELPDIATAGKWVVTQAGEDVGVVTTILIKAVWENDQETQIKVLHDAGEDRRRLLPLLGVTCLVATVGRGDATWLYQVTGHEIPSFRPPDRAT